MGSETVRPDAIGRTGNLGAWLRAIRPEQWVKNGFVLSPTGLFRKGLIRDAQWRALVVHRNERGNPTEALLTDRALMAAVVLWGAYCGAIIYFAR